MHTWKQLDVSNGRRRWSLGMGSASALGLLVLATCGEDGRGGGGVAGRPQGLSADPETGGSEIVVPGSDVARPRVLKSLDVAPSSPVILVDLGKSASRTFKVIARYADRSTADVSSLATLSIDDATLATVVGNRLDSTIRSTSGVAFANLTVRYREGTVELTRTLPLVFAFLRASGPSQDVFLTLPYGGDPASATLSSGSSVQSLDAFFAVDTTGSMGGAINNIRTSLAGTVLPAVKAAAARDAWFGVGAVEDFPSGSYGSPLCYSGPDDQPLILLQAMTSDLVKTQTAVQALLRGSSPRGCGADTPEGQIEGLYQIATGAGNVVSGVVNIPPHMGTGRGGVEFRSGALPVVAMVSDASFHTKGESGRTCFGASLEYSGATVMAAHTRSQTVAALKNVCARVVGVSIVTGSEAGCIATDDLNGFAVATGAVVPPQAWDVGTRPAACAAGQCCTGVSGAGEMPVAPDTCALVYKAQADGSGVGAGVAAAVSQLVRFAPIDVDTKKSGTTMSEDGTRLPAGHDSADFITAVTALDGTAPSMPAGLKAPTAVGDHFTGVTPGSTLRFTIQGRNDFAPAGATPQVYRAKLRVQVSACAELEDREVFILVPAA
ncbi:MAG TPA: hypothetical protein PKI03_02710 [Pseudomonadota bacterium]|nr:hypothetical protein [Pseudomonadota bacterium]